MCIRDSRWTGIPVEKLVEGEREKLLHLDDVLHQRVIGQDEACLLYTSYYTCIGMCFVYAC